MLKVTSEVLEWDATTHSITLNLPEQVKYQPRRQQTRVSVMNTNPLSAVVDPTYGAPWHAGIDNISLGGARILVMGDLRSHLHKNKPLRKCNITLENKQTISCRGKVKAFSYHSRPFRRTEISIKFESMENEDLFKLEDFIEQLSMA
jgi:c-di-GMP-binding flagellar brake protein YcgR